jgi:hypothetical protein
VPSFLLRPGLCAFQCVQISRPSTRTDTQVNSEAIFASVRCSGLHRVFVMDTSRTSAGSASPPPTSTFPLMPRKGSFQPLSNAAAPSSAASFIPLSHQLAPGPLPALLPLPRPQSGKEREGMLYPPPLLPPRHHQFVPLITVPSLPPRANNPNFENRECVDRGIESLGYGDGAERVMLGGESFDAYPPPPRSAPPWPRWGYKSRKQ